MAHLIACDIDHTLLDETGVLLEQNVQALQQAREMGATVVLATARSYGSALPIHERLELDTPLIVNNGALVCQPDGSILHAVTLEPRVAQKLFGLFGTTPHHWSVRTTERAFVHPSFDTSRPPYNDPNHYLVMEEGAYPACFGAFENVLSMSLFGAALQPFWTAHSWTEWGVSAAYYPPSHFDPREAMSLFSACSSKGKAVRWLREHLGLADVSVLAIGDSAADATMFACGIGVAPGNSCDEVRQAAHWVAPHCNEGAVAAVIKRFVLKDHAQAVQLTCPSVP
jgi:hydroxymethylpyrimidine pyrophosphatase-like HAD family hydrolase